MRKIALYLLIISLLFSGWQLFSVGGYGMKATDVSIVILILIFFKQLFFDAKTLHIPKSPIFILMLIEIVIMTISGLYPFFHGDGSMITQFFKSSIHLYYYVLLSIIFFADPPDTKIFENTIKIVLILSIAINIFGVYQLFARLYDLPLAFIKFNNVSFAAHGLEDSETEIVQLSLKFENFYRVTSIFSEPTALASFNVGILIYLIIPPVLRIKPFFERRSLNVVIFTCAIVGTFLTFSLTGLFSILIILIALMILYWYRVSKYIIPGIIISIILIVISDRLVEHYFDISVLQLFFDRISSIASMGQGKEMMSGESFTKRFDTMQKAFEIWQKSPVIGIGLGQTYIFMNETGYAFFDSSFAALLSETGIFSILCYTAMVFVWLRRAIKHLRNKRLFEVADPTLQRLIAIEFFILLLLFVNSYLTTNAVISENFWSTVAIYLAIEHHIAKINKETIYKIQLIKRPIGKLIRKSVEK